VVSITPRPCFTPGERIPGTHCTGGWVGPRAGLDAEARGKILCLCRESNPGRPVRSQTLYWLSYPGSCVNWVLELIMANLVPELIMANLFLLVCLNKNITLRSFFFHLQRFEYFIPHSEENTLLILSCFPRPFHPRGQYYITSLGIPYGGISCTCSHFWRYFSISQVADACLNFEYYLFLLLLMEAKISSVPLEAAFICFTRGPEFTTE
jgi:hypothetical protein